MASSRRAVVVAATVIVLAQSATVAVLLGGRWSGTASATWGLPLDDGWIHLVYARNLVRGLELAYNPGEPEVGTTSPLWVVLLAPAAALPDGAAALAAKVTSGLCGAILALLVAALARELAGDRAGLVAGLAVALDPELAFSAASGMEVCLAALLSVACCLALVRRKVLLAGTLLGLGLLARPETIAAAPVLVIWAAALIRKGELEPRRSVAAAAIAALLVAPVVAYCLAVTGRPLPNTFYVKSAVDFFPLEGLRVFAQGVLPRSVMLGFGAGAVLYAVGARALVRERPAAGPAIVALPWLLVVATSASRALPLAEAGTYYFTRYLHPALPLMAIPIGIGAARLLASSRKKRRRGRGRLLAGVALAVILVSAGLGLAYESERFSWNTRNIEEMQVAAGRWIARETPDDAVIAASDAGAVRFFGGRRVIDVMGLNYHPAVEARREGRIPLGTIMRDERPTHLAVIPSWFPGLERGGRARPVFEARASRYTVAAAPQGRFVVYEVVSPER